MQGVANSNTTAVMKRDPTGAARGVQQSVQDWPVGYGIRAVFHSFRFAIRRGDRSRIEMIAADRDGRLQIAAPNQFVNCFAHLGPLTIAEPADARRQALK